MKMTEDGLALIQKFEGLALESYRDAVGVWTIGYGHTSRAGTPMVTSGLKITSEAAADILARDVEAFASGVSKRVTVDLTDQQFSALVSFAFNVGLGGFERSSVLQAVNARNFDAVPRRLNLWCKAGGRILPGLIKRRAAEGALFMSGIVDSTPEPITPMTTKPLGQSRTFWSAIVVLLLAVIQAWLAMTLKLVGIAVLLAMCVALALIIFERYKKLKLEGV
jgi:lysozyme